MWECSPYDEMCSMENMIECALSSIIIRTMVCSLKKYIVVGYTSVCHKNVVYVTNLL